MLKSKSVFKIVIKCTHVFNHLNHCVYLYNSLPLNPFPVLDNQHLISNLTLPFLINAFLFSLPALGCSALLKNAPYWLIFKCLITKEWNCLIRLEGLGDVALSLSVFYCYEETA